ncbi:MAG: DUF1573 domain-containing protein [Planctomycetota bacterium]|nr:MAG: DUF1573 domain-containing protein [Planctomycetota bacterium]
MTRVQRTYLRSNHVGTGGGMSRVDGRRPAGGCCVWKARTGPSSIAAEVSMQTLRIALAALIPIAALAATIYIGRSGEQPAPTVTRRPNYDIPVPSKTGPHPKAVVPEKVYNFGVMRQGEEGSHVFVIRNEGEAPLELVARPEDTTCQCTVGKLEDGKLMPGQSTTIELKWKIKSPNPYFEHSAIVRTNDPKNSSIVLRIRGAVGKDLLIYPLQTWECGTISEDEPTVLKGSIHSDIHDSFKITKIETSSKYVSVEYRPLTAAELEELKRKVYPLTEDPPDESMYLDERAHPDPGAKEAGRSTAGSDRNSDGETARADKTEAAEIDRPEDSSPQAGEPTEPSTIRKRIVPTPKSGYHLEVTVSNEIPVGTFRETVTIHTDLPNVPPATLVIRGRRAGPLEFAALGDARWYPDPMLLRMGRFSAKQGKTVTLLLYVKDVPDFRITASESDEPVLHIVPELDEAFKGNNRLRYRVRISVPANSPPADRALPNPANVVLRTNQQGPLSTINFRVEFVAD